MCVCSAQVLSNQLILSPIVLSTVFTWNLALSNKASEIGTKIKRDLLPTAANGMSLRISAFGTLALLQHKQALNPQRLAAGWKFWVPASSINFYAVPVQHQVLYMSACGILWTAYLSYASVNEIARPPAPAPLVLAKAKAK